MHRCSSLRHWQYANAAYGIGLRVTCNVSFVLLLAAFSRSCGEHGCSRIGVRAFPFFPFFAVVRI